MTDKETLTGGARSRRLDAHMLRKLLKKLAALNPFRVLLLVRRSGADDPLPDDSTPPPEGRVLRVFVPLALVALLAAPVAYMVRFDAAGFGLSALWDSAGPRDLLRFLLPLLLVPVAIALVAGVAAYVLSSQARPSRPIRRLIIVLFAGLVAAEVLWLRDFTRSQETDLLLALGALAVLGHYLFERGIARRSSNHPPFRALIDGPNPFVVAWRVVPCLLLLGALVMAFMTDSGLDRFAGLLPIWFAAYFMVALGGAAGAARVPSDSQLIVPREALATVTALCILVLLWRSERFLLFTALFGVLVALGCLWIAHRSGKRFRPFAVAVALAVVAFAGVATALEQKRSPTVEPFAAVSAEGRLVCGVLVGERAGTFTYARYETGSIDSDAVLRRVELETSPARHDPVTVRRALRQAAALRARVGIENGYSRDVLDSDPRCPAPYARADGHDTEWHAVAKRLQPVFVLDGADESWPVPVSTIFGMEGRSAPVCLKRVAARACVSLSHAAELDWVGELEDVIRLPARMDRFDQRRLVRNALADGHLEQGGEDLTDPRRSAAIYFLLSPNSPEFRSWSIQYWKFDSYNYFPALNFLPDPLAPEVGKHQGDFEQVGVVTTGSDAHRPRYFWMSRHEPAREGRPYAWDEPGTQREGDRARVMVSRGSHASYDRCGRQIRYEAPLSHVIDDVADCEGPELGPETPLIDLARVPWACWRGTWGRRQRGFLERVIPHAIEAAPRGPLYQQTFDRHLATPCVDAPAPPARAGATEEVLPPATSAALRRGAGRLEHWFDECEDWEKPPARGVYAVVCDQAALQRFFAAGLETVPPDGPRIDAGRPSASALTVPAVRRDPDARDFAGWTISGRARDARVYVACRTDGRVLAATFEAVALDASSTFRIATPASDRWQLTDGTHTIDAPVTVVAGRGSARAGCG